MPGKNTMVTAAMVIIDELSFWVSKAILAVRSAIPRLVRLSAWEPMLNKRLIINFVRSR